jgi:hypothetical protein
MSGVDQPATPAGDANPDSFSLGPLPGPPELSIEDLR